MYCLFLVCYCRFPFQSEETVELRIDDKINLNKNAACFSVLDSSIIVDPDKSSFFIDSQVSSLPNYVLEQFRIVNMVRPDSRLMLQAQFTSEGIYLNTLNKIL